MSKLTAENKFLDLSDYGRLPATFLANQLKHTRFTPIHVTLLFGVVGLLAVFCILHEQFVLAGLLLILKSILDAADGELSRVKNTPSYTGRYLDSLFDIVLNFLFLFSICYISTSPFYVTLLAFFAVQLQGTLYNYYYVILRNNSVGGDATSKIFETKIPKAFPDESQRTVSILFVLFLFFYGIFDRIIYYLDRGACKVSTFPNWFMTLVSIYGLGFQLLIMAFMLSFQLFDYIIPFFIYYSLFMVLFVSLRRYLLN